VPLRNREEIHNSLTEQLDEQSRSLSNTSLVQRKRKISSTSSEESDSDDCPEVIDIENVEEVLVKSKVKEKFSTSNRVEKLQLIHID
jgi:hypothetical protein